MLNPAVLLRDTGQFVNLVQIFDLGLYLQVSRLNRTVVNPSVV